MPPDGDEWCPLCSELIQPNNFTTWRKHLVNDCYNNPRNCRWPKIGYNEENPFVFKIYLIIKINC